MLSNGYGRGKRPHQMKWVEHVLLWWRLVTSFFKCRRAMGTTKGRGCGPLKEERKKIN